MNLFSLSSRFQSRLLVAAGVSILGAAQVFGAERIELFGVAADGMTPGLIFFAIAAATLISEDLAAISAGVLASQGTIGFPLAVASTGAGILFGDILLFIAGRYLGRPALRLPFVGYFLTERALERSSAWLEHRGMAAIFISRFVIGLRLPLYFAAGVLQTSFVKFTAYFLLAVAVWTPLLVGASYYLGGQVVSDTMSNKWFAISLIAIVVGLFIAVRLAQQLATWKGRRILRGKVQRRFIWEFWSVRIFYLPVIVKIAMLACKYRSLTVFTCANPGIPAGGFVGESKNDILRLIALSPGASRFVLPHELLAGTDRIDSAVSFMERRALDFPVVIKPDAGERGLGVRIVRSAEELRNVLESSSEPLIIQEFAPGDEISVFYYRYPETERGEIFAITEKRFPAVSGDGHSTLEELILKDNRAICLAKCYLDHNEASLDRVPADGEIVPIIDIGTHSRGAVFLDGGWMKTPEAEAVIDAICIGIDGFNFGRFDIRVESYEHFRRGEAFRIVELNGVTSEATNIYDPNYSLRDAYATLFRQWEIAFEIGARNHELGAHPATVRELMKMTVNRPSAHRPRRASLVRSANQN